MGRYRHRGIVRVVRFGPLPTGPVVRLRKFVVFITKRVFDMERVQN